MYVPGRYGTLKSLCLGYSIHGCCHTLIHYFSFLNLERVCIIKVDGRLVGYTFARTYACVCTWLYVSIDND